ncbi:unnamed protein product [Closterium sp. Naga37s-1]|nr:unnamed protein product [Closterium sp. Naga37s-1]
MYKSPNQDSPPASLPPLLAPTAATSHGSRLAPPPAAASSAASPFSSGGADESHGSDPLSVEAGGPRATRGSGSASASGDREGGEVPGVAGRESSTGTGVIALDSAGRCSNCSGGILKENAPRGTGNAESDVTGDNGSSSSSSAISNALNPMASEFVPIFQPAGPSLVFVLFFLDSVFLPLHFRSSSPPPVPHILISFSIFTTPVLSAAALPDQRQQQPQQGRPAEQPDSAGWEHVRSGGRGGRGRGRGGLSASFADVGGGARGGDMGQSGRGRGGRGSSSGSRGGGGGGGRGGAGRSRRSVSETVVEGTSGEEGRGAAAAARAAAAGGAGGGGSGGGSGTAAVAAGAAEEAAAAAAGPAGAVASGGRGRRGVQTQANHLLNFQPYQPTTARGVGAALGGSAGGGGGTGSGRWWQQQQQQRSRAHRTFNRDLFLQVSGLSPLQVAAHSSISPSPSSLVLLLSPLFPLPPLSPPPPLLPSPPLPLPPLPSLPPRQANCRFLVSDCGDYNSDLADADRMPDWADVAAVEITETTDCPAGAGADGGSAHRDAGGGQRAEVKDGDGGEDGGEGGGAERGAGGDSIAGGASGTLSCPICLDSPPLCPQITACGHVFCHPCILRHFATPDARHPDAPPLRPATVASAAAAAAVARAVAAGGSPQRALRALSDAAAPATSAVAATGGWPGLGGRGTGRGGAGPAGRGGGRGGSGKGAAAAAVAAPVVLPSAGLASSVVQRFKRCPLCFASIGSHELRTVTIRSVPAPRVGHMLRFVALMRSKACVVPFEMHRHHREHFSLASLPFSSTGRCHAFSKLTLTSDSGAATVTDAAVRALLQRVEEVNESGGEELEQLPYVMDAVNQLLDRQQAWVEHRQMAFVAASPSHQKGLLSLLKLPIDLPPPPLSPSAYPSASLSASSPASHRITSPRARSSPSFPSPPTASATAAGRQMAALQLEQEERAAGGKGEAQTGREKTAELEVAKGEEGDGVGDEEEEEEEACIEEAEEEGSVGAGGEDVAEEVERAMHELEARAGWVYESAFSDDEGEDEREGKGGAGKGDAAVLSAEAPAAAVADAAGDSEGAAERRQGGDRIGEGMGGSSGAGGEAASTEKGGRAEKHEGVGGQGEGRSWAGRGGKGKAGERVGEGEEVCGWHVFYQAQEGPCVVLHPLNFKCLLQHYGSVERLPLRHAPRSSAPSVFTLVIIPLFFQKALFLSFSHSHTSALSSPHFIATHGVPLLLNTPAAPKLPSRPAPYSVTARVVQLEPMRQSEAVRRRLRVVDHLPLTAAFVLAEVDLAPLLPAPSLAPFLPEINHRRLQRQRQLRQEERDRVKAQHREAVAVAAAAEDGRFFERQRVPAPMDFVPLAQAVAAGSASATAAAEDSETGGGDVAAGSAEGEGVSGSASHAPPMAFSKVTELGYAAGLGSVALSAPSLSAATAPPPPSGPSPVSAAATPVQSVWASRPDFSRAGAAGAAAGSGAWGSGRAAAAGGGRVVGSGGQVAQMPGDDGSGSSGGGKGKGKKGKKKGTTILLSSGGLPRY